MNLTPKIPPGRANRKALAFTAEIDRLRTAGYSFEAIRVALLEAGLNVSRTTVKREAARNLGAATTSPKEHLVQASVTSDPLVPSDLAIASASFAGDSRSGKEIAEAFMKRRVSNPLIQERIKNESRSD